MIWYPIHLVFISMLTVSICFITVKFTSLFFINLLFPYSTHLHGPSTSAEGYQTELGSERIQYTLNGTYKNSNK